VGKGQKNTELDDLIGAIYEAGLEPATWQHVIAGIFARLGAHAGQLWSPYTPSPEKGGVVISVNIEDGVRPSYLAYYHQHDVWSQRLAEHGLTHTGSAFLGQELLTDVEWRNTEFWNDFLQPMDLYHLCGGIVDDGSIGSLPLMALVCYRGIAKKPFGTMERNLVTRLLPHLRRSLGIQSKLNPRRTSAAELALDTLTMPVMVLAQDGRCLHVNAAAERLTASHPGIRLRNGRLSLSQGVAQRRLDEMLCHARDAFTRLPPGPATLFVGDPASDGLVFSFSPAMVAGMFGKAEAAAIVFVRQRNASISFHPEELQSTYGLTDAEVALALALTRGVTLKEHAAARGVSINTVRAQLKQVLSKTGTARQTDVVRLILGRHAAPV